MKDPYEALGVEKTASVDDIRKAYRRLAKKLHPDLNPGNKKAEEQFKEVSAAYDLLSDADKRARFDRGEIDASGAERPRQRFYRDFATGAEADHHYADASGYEDFAQADDFLSELLRRREHARANAPGADLHYRLPVEFLDAVNGATVRLDVPDGGTLEVKIPPGIESGQMLRLRGKGAPGRGQGKPGDALIEVDNFGEDEHDLRLQRVGSPRVASTPVVGAGGRATLATKLAPGRYVLFCSLADHRARGMRAVLTVRR